MHVRGRVLWWFAIAWLAVAVAIVAASFASWLSGAGSPYRHESSIAASIALLYSSPAVVAIVFLTFNSRFRIWKVERVVAWSVLGVGVVLVSLFTLMAG